MSALSLLTDVLFVGHSLIGMELPPMLETALRQGARPEAVVEAQVINGAPLRWAWDHSAEAQGVDARARLAEGDRAIDALILTEAIPLAAQIEWNDSSEYVARWAATAWEQAPQTQVFIYETWHSLKSGTGVAVEHDPGADVAWTQRIAADLEQWEGLAMQAEAIRPAEAPPLRLIPAGQAMARAALAARAGTLPGIDHEQGLFADDIHPNGRGLYLLAMVHYAALTGESPVGLPVRLVRSWPNRDAVIFPELAQALQQIAWDAVQEQRARETRRADAAQAAPQDRAADLGPAQARAAADAPFVAAGPGLLRPHDPVTNPNLALGLSGVADWMVSQPFLDVMKTARPWIGHRPGQWGGVEHADLAQGGHLDENGWPRVIPPGIEALATLVLTDLPADAGGVAGRYLVRWQGQGVVQLSGRAQNVQPAEQGLTFDFQPGDGGVVLTISETTATDPLRNITIVRTDRVALHDAGQIFNPDWLGRIRGARMLRFMDWMATNGSPVARIEDSPAYDDYTWARVGVPVEVMVALANELDADAWFTVPHLADDALVRFQAETVADLLEPGRRAWVEYSNEVWNWQFPQAHWADAQGKALWGEADGSAWVQFYARRAAEVAAIWSDAFGAGDFHPDRLAGP